MNGQDRNTLESVSRAAEEGERAYDEAVKLCRAAAERGEAAAQCKLGGFYEQGRGVEADAAEAVKWYRKAAGQGYKIAQHNLGLCYEYGRGVTADKAEALNWYRKAAEQGHKEAQAKLRRLEEPKGFFERLKRLFK